MKVSDYVVQRLAFLGVSDCFAVTGGGAMHLNDSFGECEKIRCWYMHHEQAAAIAAEGYARISRKPAILNVTTGPGAINALNGVFGAFTDSVPMIVVAGQVRSDTISTSVKGNVVRQLGDQELRSIPMVKEITKYQKLVLSVDDLISTIDDGFLQSISGRPGPVWIEIPVNIQGMNIDADPEVPLMLQSDGIEKKDDYGVIDILQRISVAKRPIILSGSGVRIAGVEDLVLQLAVSTSTPIVTAWTHDTIQSDHPLFAGRAGTIGTRPGNFCVQASDLVIVLGSRLNIRQVSYNWDSFAKNAEIIWIDIDSSEFDKPYMSRKSVTKVNADLKDLLPILLNLSFKIDFNHKKWISWCQEIKNRYDLKPSDYVSTSEGINAYHLIPEITELASADTTLVCGNATACIVPFQAASLREGMRMFSNSGSASMGYDLPASLGAAIADQKRSVVCLAGDGSIMMNIQELESLKNWNLNVLVIVLENQGYLSIKQTQQNFFGHDHGASPKSGITFPDYEAVANAFGIKSARLDPSADWKRQLSDFMSLSGPRLLLAPLEISQEFIPRLKSKMIEGSIVTPELDDMFPHLSDQELIEVRESALKL